MKGKIITTIVMTLVIAATVLPVAGNMNINKSQDIYSTTENLNNCYPPNPVDWHISPWEYKVMIRLIGNLIQGMDPLEALAKALGCFTIKLIIDPLMCLKVDCESHIRIGDETVLPGEFVGDELSLTQEIDYFYNNEHVANIMTDSITTFFGNGSYSTMMYSYCNGTFPPCPQKICFEDMEDYLLQCIWQDKFTQVGVNHVESEGETTITFDDRNELRLEYHRDYFYSTGISLPFEEVAFIKIEDVDVNETVSWCPVYRFEPAVRLNSLFGDFGLTTVIENLGETQYNNVSWSIDIEPVPQKGFIFWGGHKTGLVNIGPDSSKSFRRFCIGFGDVLIKVKIGSATWISEANLFIIKFNELTEPQPQPA